MLVLFLPGRTCLGALFLSPSDLSADLVQAENNKWQEATMQQAIRELEELENGLKIQTVVTKGS